MSSTSVHGLAGGLGQGAASECQELLSFFFFLVLNKRRNCIQADGDCEINCGYKVSLQGMPLCGRNGCSDTEPQTGRPPLTRGRQGRFEGPGPQSPMVTEPWTRNPWESLPGSPTLTFPVHSHSFNTLTLPLPLYSIHINLYSQYFSFLPTLSRFPGPFMFPYPGDFF